MAGDSVKASLEDRLQLHEYSRSECLAAIRGESVLYALSQPVHRFCTIRGIRYHPGFGNELRGVLPVFTRSLNARSIMSNVIPDFESPSEVPYCIWHPVTASEETYRELARRYPYMAYHVGRACAVAGYTQLYTELDTLPDTHIAEEARECGNLAIYDAIMSRPVRYSIMDDYELSVDAETRQPAHLNGDTSVKWMLDFKQEFRDADDDSDPMFLFNETGYEYTTFDITEDMHIDEFESVETPEKRTLATRTALRLLCEPLPVELPILEKDILIVMAAYLGDVDRYARLRRPKRVSGEVACCIRGIYHNTFFAVWCSKQPGYMGFGIEKAINARFIMNNVLARAPFPSGDIPYLIWWPTIARESTYSHLAKLQPEMLPQIIRACIYAGYKDLFDELLPQVTPDHALVREAEKQGNLHFRQALNERIQLLALSPQDLRAADSWKWHISDDFGKSTTYVSNYLNERSVETDFYSPYDGRSCDASAVELMACLPDAWKLAANDERGFRDLDYEEWPNEVIGAAENE